MVNQDVLNYIKGELLKGTSREMIANNLISGGGWTKAEVDFHFGFVNESAPAPAAVPVPSPKPELQNMVNQIAGTLPAVENPPSPMQNLQDIDSILAASTERKGSGFKVFLLIFILAVLIIGAGAFGYYYVNYLNPDPGKVFAKMMLNLSDIKSFEYSYDLSGTADINQGTSSPSGISGSATLMLKQDGDIDFSDDSNVISKQKTAIKLNASSPASPLALNLNLIVDSELLDHLLYIKMDELPGFLSAFIDPAKVNGQWFILSTSTVETAEAIRPGATTTLSSVDREKIASLWTNLELYPIVAVTKNLGSEMIGDVNTYHYAYELNKNNVKTLIPIIFKMFGADPGEEKAAVDSLDAIKEADGEIWIGRDDFYPYKVTGKTVEDLSKTSTSTQISGQLSADVTLNASKFNQKFILTAPAGAKPVEDLMSSTSTSTTTTINHFMPR